MYTSICDACLSYARKQMGSHDNNSNDNDEKNECVDKVQTLWLAYQKI